MPKALSLDLRKCIVEAYESGEGSFQTLARVFNVHFQTVRNLVLRALENNGDPIAKPCGGVTTFKITPDHHEVLRQIVAEKPDLILREIAAELHTRTGLSVAISTIDRHLNKLGLTRKKKRSGPRSSSRKRSKPRGPSSSWR